MFKYQQNMHFKTIEPLWSIIEIKFNTGNQFSETTKIYGSYQKGVSRGQSVKSLRPI